MITPCALTALLAAGPVLSVAGASLLSGSNVVVVLSLRLSTRPPVPELDDALGGLTANHAVSGVFREGIFT